jgi:hypothetical protein
MVTPISTAGLAGLAGTALIFLSSIATAVQPQPVPHKDDDVSVQARGPVHEAFAQPFVANPQPGPVVAKKPPDPIPEEPPDQKPQAQNVVWIPGYWAWDDDRKDFLWVSGVWRVPPPDRKWVPGYWNKADNGWRWVAGNWAPLAQEQPQIVPEPPESLDYGPSSPAPDDGSTYIPGSWLYRDTGYVWRPGFWNQGYSDWLWYPSSYTWTPAGCVYSPGYWDYPLVDRGLLFAPVCFNGAPWTTPGWCYRPGFAVNLGGLLSCWWARPGWGHYYFGDYFGAGYRAAGFHPWLTYGARFHDPLFGYNRWAHRGDPGWFGGLRNRYLGWQDGRVARPGWRTGLVTPLSQYRGGAYRLGNVTAGERSRFNAGVQNYRNTVVNRGRIENAASWAGRGAIGRASVATPAQRIESGRIGGLDRGMPYSSYRGGDFARYSSAPRSYAGTAGAGNIYRRSYTPNNPYRGPSDFRANAARSTPYRGTPRLTSPPTRAFGSPSVGSSFSRSFRGSPSFSRPSVSHGSFGGGRSYGGGGGGGRHR